MNQVVFNQLLQLRKSIHTLSIQAYQANQKELYVRLEQAYEEFTCLVIAPSLKDVSIKP